MDETQEYVEMCSKLPDEIRYDYQMFDFVIDPTSHIPKQSVIIHKEIRNKTIGREFTAGTYDHNWIVKPPWVRVLRQDQLQAMLGNVEPYRLFNRLSSFGETVTARTPEQLTLSYVMHEKYGLNWSSERKEWI